MFEPICMIEGKAIADAKEDLRIAQKVEQYRISSRALYLPEGLRWKYLPLPEIERVDSSFRVISGGHCVPVREKRPEIDLMTAMGPVHLQLEKQASVQTILDMLDGKAEQG